MVTDVMRLFPKDYTASLSETITWCSLQPPNEWAHREFRTPELAAGFPYGEPPSMRNYDIQTMQHLLLGTVRNRRNRLRAVTPALDSGQTTLSGGRLLQHNLAETTGTDMPREQSGGFFDEWDLPPHDCWVTMVSRDVPGDFGVIISWIPAWLVSTVDECVQTSFEENNLWLSAQQQAIWLPLLS